MGDTDKAVTKFDPARLMDAVRDRIKAEFVALIPEDAWHKLIDGIVVEFMVKGLKELVIEELKKEVGKRLCEYFSSQEWNGQWNMHTQNTDAGEQARKIITENVPAIVTAAIGYAFQGVIDGMRNNLQRPHY